MMDVKNKVENPVEYSTAKSRRNTWSEGPPFFPVQGNALRKGCG
jgi:hypothetical protein